MVKLIGRIAIALVLGVSLTAGARGKSCTLKDAEAADELVDHMDSWAKVDSALKRFGHCDDGSIAEGNSEAVARLLVDQWATLPALADLIKTDPPLKRFVLRHIDSTLDTHDLEKIKALATSSCVKDLAVLCADLTKSATHTTK